MPESFFKKDAASLTLRLKRSLDSTCDASAVQPLIFEKLNRSEIGSVQLTADSRSIRLDEVFEVIGNPSRNLIFDGDCSKLTGIGAGMDGGTVLVRGNAGSGLASHMKAGRIEVLGDCGDGLVTEMRNGTVIIHGSAGDRVAGPAVGQRRGMRGGDCVILGNVGDRMGERMRRGMVYVAGNAGDLGAVQMIAGTVIVMGEIGSHWAQGMKRGSIILSHSNGDAFAAELTPAREFELSFLPLIWRHLEALFEDFPMKISSSRWAMRQLGDRANSGLGEILTLTRQTSL